MPKTKEKKKINYFAKYIMQKKWSLFFYLFITVAFHIIGVVITLMTADFLEQITTYNFTAGIRTLAIFLSLALANRSSYWLSCLLFTKSMSAVSLKIKTDLAKRSFELSSKTFSDSSSGVFITRITRDSEESFYRLDSLVESFSEIISFSITIIYIMVLNIWIGLVMAAGIIILGFMEIWRVKVYGRNKKAQMKVSERVTSLTNEIVRSEKDIKALNLEGSLKELSYNTYHDYKVAYEKTTLTDMNFWNIRSILCTVVAAGLCILSFFLLKNVYITIASFMFVFMNRSALQNVVWNVGAVLRNITECKISCNRMFEVFDEEKFASERFGTIELKECKGKIEFKDVHFDYEDYLSKTDEVKDGPKKKKKKKDKTEDKPRKKINVFDGLSFTIQPNRTVAFVGKSGSGKSTILNLIAKMYECDSGQILLDGIDVKDLDKPSLRNNISLVNQFPYIFDTTIKENLLMAKKDATDQELKDACKRASLWEFIDGLTNKMETKVGESGIKLSGGQKQRLAIARALLRNSKIILFDESTSSLDNFAQAEIKESIDSLSGDNTVVIVAHRLSTIKNADEIFFLEDGKIVASGTFEKLYKTNKEFKSMFKTENVFLD